MNININTLGCLYKGKSPAFLESALASLLSQTYAIDEILLILDCPLLKSHEDVIAQDQHYTQYNKNPW